VDFGALSAVGPGIMRGQQQQAEVQQQQLQNEQTQAALAAIARARQGASWAGAGNLGAGFDAANPSPASPLLPRGAPPGGVAGAPPAPSAAPGGVGGMPSPLPTDTLALQQHLKQAGFDPGALDGVMGPRTQSALDAYKAAQPPSPAPDAAAPADPGQMAGGGSADVGSPPSQEGGSPPGQIDYDPMQSMRQVMHLADFIGHAYKQQTGQDMDPQTLLEQVERVSKLANAFTPAQRVGMQGAVAQLRAVTSTGNNVRSNETRASIADNHDATSASNTDKRVEQSDKNNKRTTSTSRANNADSNATSASNNANTNNTRRDLAGLVDTRQRELAKAQNDLKAAIAAGKDTAAMQRAVLAAKSRLDVANVQMGKEPAADAAPAPAAAPKGAKAWSPPAGLPPARGIADGTKARGSDGKVAAVARGGQWVAPPAGS
jgi:hypothetical protein